jgi:hypothetical protein
VKSPASVPITEIPAIPALIVWEMLSLLVSVAVMAALGEPWLCGPKVRLLGETLIGGTVGTTPAIEFK